MNKLVIYSNLLYDKVYLCEVFGYWSKLNAKTLKAYIQNRSKIKTPFSPLLLFTYILKVLACAGNERCIDLKENIKLSLFTETMIMCIEI